jgi:hypothetical protein
VWLLLQALNAEEQALLQGMGDEARRISSGGAGAAWAAAGRQQLGLGRSGRPGLPSMSISNLAAASAGKAVLE